MAAKQLLLGSIFLLALISVVSGSESTDEQAIRAILLKDYDKTVRPAKHKGYRVEFGVKFTSLNEVNTKDETVTIETWVVMKWNNSFFSWNRAKYGVDRVYFLPSEIWFPDIALYNNGDPKFPFAGGTAKFLSHVIVNDKGMCTWSGPVAFTATFDAKIRPWPFDNQHCHFEFSSFSYDSKKLTLSTIYLQRSDLKGNANWQIHELSSSVEETDRGDCCPYKFSQITYTLKLKRLYDYQMFYIFVPCAVLIILSLLSFFVPSESGERIGYITTLLLSLTVYLLVVPDSLPVSSQEIPVLGVLLMATLIIISLVLLATILVLICFHRIGTPPAWLRFLASKSSTLVPTTIHVMEMQMQHRDSRILPEPEPIPNLQTPQHFEPPPELDLSWQIISFKLDWIFFWVFLITSAITYVILLSRPLMSGHG